MAERAEIIAHCDELLDVARFRDYGPNGLQVPGAERVERVVSGVSAHRRLIELAVQRDAQLVLCHHGLLWDFHPRALTPQLAERLRLLLTHEVSLAGYHLPLDAHREIGNNVLLCRALGFEVAEQPFAAVKGEPIGAIGRGAERSAAALAERLAEVTGRRPLHLPGGEHPIRSIGVVTGAAASSLAEAVALGLDAFVTGEPAEHAMADAREGGVHFFAAGHYATETLGIRRLGELVAERFGVEHDFVAVPNPV